MKRTIKKWNEKQDSKVIQLYQEGCTLREICEELNRSKDSIAKRIGLFKRTKEISIEKRNKAKDTGYYAGVLKNIENFYNGKLRTLHKQSKNSTSISPENRKVIEEVDQENKLAELTPNTRWNHIRYAAAFITKINKNFKEVTLQDLKDFLEPLVQNKQKTTANLYKNSLKFLYNHLQKENPSKNIMRITAFLNESKRGRKKEGYKEQEKEHLTRQEVVMMVRGIKGKDINAIRNRALLAVLYDSGARRSELLSVKQQDCFLDGKIPHIYLPESKTRPRDSCMLKFSLPYMMEWVKAHEFWQKPEAPLFYSMSSSNYGEPLKNNMVGLILKKAMRIAGIKKKISPHSLRHTKAFHLAQDGVKQQEANVLFGWGRTSQMFLHYSQVNKAELEEAQLERQGKLSEEEQAERKLERNAFVMKRCARCGKHSTPDQLLCSHCGLASSKEVAKAEIKREEKKDSEIAELRAELSKVAQSVVKVLNHQEVLMKKAEAKQA